MKRITSLLTIALGALFVFSGVVYAKGEVRVTFSRLPEKAKIFITTYFGAKPKTKEMELDKKTGEYSVELRNGYEMKFDSDGKLIEIDSPDRAGSVVSQKIINAVLPAKAVQYLQTKNYIDNVDEIKVLSTGGYEVDIDQRGTDIDLYFDSNGNLIR